MWILFSDEGNEKVPFISEDLFTTKYVFDKIDQGIYYTTRCE